MGQTVLPGNCPGSHYVLKKTARMLKRVAWQSIDEGILRLLLSHHSPKRRGLNIGSDQFF